MRVRKRVAVVGASGFGRETLDVLDAMIAAGAELEVVGVIDDAPSALNLSRLYARGTGYLGTLEEWVASADHEVQFVVGIGNPSVRARVSQRLEDCGFTAHTAVHPTATLGASSYVAEGVVICAGVVISTNVHLERHVHINPHATVGHDTTVNAFVSVNPAATISGEVTIASEALIGAGAIILQGLRVGPRTVVGAGAVVTKDVPSDVVVVGVPGVWKPLSGRSGEMPLPKAECE